MRNPSLDVAERYNNERDYLSIYEHESTVIYVWPAVRAAPVWLLAVGVDCCMQRFFRSPPLESFFRSSPHLTAVASTQCEY